MYSEILVAGSSIGLIIFLVWAFLINKIGMDVTLARGYIMTLMVFMQNVHVLNCRSEYNSTFKVPFKNPMIIFSIILHSFNTKDHSLHLLSGRDTHRFCKEF